jgi:flavin-dependent dehydrogenase
MSRWHGFFRESAGPGWALVGDAGYWADPLSTHGMTAALGDAELLARAVLAAPAPGPQQHDALAAYESARDQRAVPLLEVIERLAAYDWDLPGVRRLLMALSSAMTDELELIGAMTADAGHG